MSDELAQMLAKFVVRVGRDMVELVHRDQPVVERFDPELVDREAERRMGADQHLVVAFQEDAERIDLPAIVVAWRIAEVPPRLDVPVSPETMLAQRSSWKLEPMDFSGTTMMACLTP